VCYTISHAGTPYPCALLSLSLYCAHSIVVVMSLCWRPRPRNRGPPVLLIIDSTILIVYSLQQSHAVGTVNSNRSILSYCQYRLRLCSCIAINLQYKVVYNIELSAAAVKVTMHVSVVLSELPHIVHFGHSLWRGV
jgi:hypothetical protein